MTTIKMLGLASAGAIALASASGAAAATTYLFDFQIAQSGAFTATNIVYAADSLDPASLTYVSGSVNGATTQTLTSQAILNFRRFEFTVSGVAEGQVAGMQFNVLGPFQAGQTYTTNNVFRYFPITSGGFFGIGTTGQLTITEQLPAVPEPATWAMLILGFGAIGGAMRRRTAVRLAYA